MKSKKYILLLLFASLINCSKPKQDLNIGSTNSKIQDLLKLAQNQSFNNAKKEEYNLRALQLLQTQTNHNIENLFTIANNTFVLEDWPTYKKATVLALQKALQDNKIANIAKSYRYLGGYYMSIKNNDSALYFFYKSEKLYVKLNDKFNVGNVVLKEGMAQFYANDYLGADISISKAYNLLKDSNDKRLIFMSISMLGIISSEMKDYRKAIAKQKIALDLIYKYKLYNAYNESTTLSNIGNGYQELMENTTAVHYFYLALKNKKLKLECPDLYATLIDNLGYAKFKLNNLKELPELFHESLKLRESLNITTGIVLSNIHLSEFYAQQKDTAKSQNYARAAVVEARKSKTPDNLMEGLKQLSLVDRKNASIYSKEYIKINDSLQQAERKSQNKIMRIQFETDDVITQKNDAVHQKWFFAVIAFTLLIFGLLLFIIIIQRNRQKELKFAQKQQKANEEIFQLIQNQHLKMEEGKQIEKKRIAKDLHDGIMNRLASTRLNLHVLNERKDLQTIEKCLPFIDNIQVIEKEIRDIAHDLNQDVFSNTDSFTKIIESLSDDQNSISKINCHLEIDNDINWDLIESTKKIHIYRILQEALQNANKHSQAKNIIISMTKRPDSIFIEIYDDGVGFSINRKNKGIGLQNIFSRVKECDGEINLLTQSGTTISITIPIKKNKGIA